MFKIIYSSVPVIVGGPTNVTSGNTNGVPASQSSTGTSAQICLSLVGDNSSSSIPPVDANKSPTSAFGNEDLHEQPAPSSSSSSVLPTPVSTLAVCFSTSDPVLVPSNDSRLPGSVGTIKREVGSHHPPGEPNATRIFLEILLVLKTFCFPSP